MLDFEQLRPSREYYQKFQLQLPKILVVARSYDNFQPVKIKLFGVLEIKLIFSDTQWWLNEIWKIGKTRFDVLSLIFFNFKRGAIETHHTQIEQLGDISSNTGA